MITKNMSLADIVKQLPGAKLNTEIYSLNVEELIDFIEDSHHIEERELLRNLERLVNKILIVHYEHHSEELIKVHHLFSDLKKELEEHFVKEEQVVFPMMKENTVATDKLLSLIKELKLEHEAAGEIIKQLKSATNDFNAPKDACPTFISTYQNLEKLVNDIFLHIYAETSVLFEKFE